MVFYDWLLSISMVFSGFIHTIACARPPFLFIDKYCSTAQIKHIKFLHLSVDGHVCFHFGGSMNNIATNTCVQACVWTRVFLGEELLGHLVTLRLTFSSTCFKPSCQPIKHHCKPSAPFLPQPKKPNSFLPRGLEDSSLFLSCSEAPDLIFSVN